jgi:hypothetical protein
MSMIGIKSLIYVAQMKASSANDDALRGADKQRALVEQKKTLRTAQNTVELQTSTTSYFETNFTAVKAATSTTIGSYQPTTTVAVAPSVDLRMVRIFP